MKIDDLENELRNLKLTHLTGSELAAYCDQELDRIRSARAEAHIKQCFICERQLELLREESAALRDRRITSEDIALVERLMAQPAREASLKERLADYLQQMVASWKLRFAPVRGGEDEGEEVWRWQSEDGRLRVRAVMEKNDDLMVHFSSSEIDLDDTRINFRIGSVSRELTLRRVSDSEVAANITITVRERHDNMLNIAIEIL